MRIESSAKHNQNFTSVLPTVVMVNGALSSDSLITEKVMVQLEDILVKKFNLTQAQVYLKNKFTSLIPKFEFTPAITNINKSEFTKERPFLGYFFTDETAKKLSKLQNDRPDTDSEILNNLRYRAISPKDGKFMGLYINAQKNAAGKLDITSIDFHGIPEEKFIPQTCLIA